MCACMCMLSIEPASVYNKRYLNMMYIGLLFEQIPSSLHTIKVVMVHYIDVTMTAMASQITSLTIVYSTIYSDADQRKHQSYASLAFVWGIHRDRWIPRTKGRLRGKCFHLMTSSCYIGFSLVKILHDSLHIATKTNWSPSCKKLCVDFINKKYQNQPSGTFSTLKIFVTTLRKILKRIAFHTF